MGIERIKFNYKFDHAYNPTFITGVHGGITPKNHIIMNFFYERHPLPTSITNEVDKMGRIGKELHRIPEEEEGTLDVVRFVETGISIDLGTALEIQRWLQDQIDILAAIPMKYQVTSLKQVLRNVNKYGKSIETFAVSTPVVHNTPGKNE